MPSKQIFYDVTPEQREILLWRDAKRKQLRELYLKESGHPTKSLLFDAGIYRYASAKSSLEYHFVPRAINLISQGVLVIGSITALACFLKKSRDAREHKFRTGQIPYADRNKFL